MFYGVAERHRRTFAKEKASVTVVSANVTQSVSFARVSVTRVSSANAMIIAATILTAKFAAVRFCCLQIFDQLHAVYVFSGVISFLTTFFVTFLTFLLQ